MKKSFLVEGMTCAGCAMGVEHAVNTISSVKSAQVNLVTKTLLVESEKDVTDQVIKNVKMMGFKISSIADASKKNIKQLNIKEYKQLLGALIWSAVFLLPLMYVSMGHMIGLPLPTFMSQEDNPVFWVLAQLLLTLPILIVNRNYFISGFKKLFLRKPNMDSLVALGTTSAFLYGVYAFVAIVVGTHTHNHELIHNFSHDIYFESAATILTLITLGKFLEHRSKNSTQFALEKLLKLSPDTVTLFKNNEYIEEKAENIAVGDIIFVKPGSRVAVDGEIVEGESFVDQSAITGESMPVYKTVGDNIISATINNSGAFYYKATHVGDDTTLAKIIALVEEAANSKAPISKMADKISAIFVPVVLVISILTAVVWALLGDISQALTNAVAVLAISCPCALGLATPLAIMVGTGIGAERGILIKSAESLELTHKADTIVFDKTGTLTFGLPEVVDVFSLDMDKNKLVQIAYSLEHSSEHPLSFAVQNYAKQNEISLKKTTGFVNILGKGVAAKINNVEYFVGNEKLLNENKLQTEQYSLQYEQFLDEGKTVVFVFTQTKILGLITLSDKIKPTSYTAVSSLKKMGVETWLITGDNEKTAAYVKKELGIDHMAANTLPADKERYIKKLQADGRVVAFVGDGINDAPALTSADIGISIGSGTDIAIESANIILTHNNLEDVVTAIALSRQTLKNIKQNLFWAFFYNSVSIPIATGALSGLGLFLNPMVAAFAMSVSSLFVVLNSLRLKMFKPNLKNGVKNNEQKND